MKHGGLVFAGVTLALFCTFCPAFSYDETVNYQTYMIDTFDKPDGEWTWHAVGSKFVTENFPVVKYFDGMPHAIRVMQEDPENAKFLGMQVKFNRKGNNWVDIVPAKKGENGLEPYEIPFKGNIHRLDMWVWGAGYYHTLEILVRDCNGRVHTLSFGNLSFKGWKNMSVSVPKNIPQSSRYLGNTKYMSFVAFRLRTNPTERVDDFYIFFDQFKALTNVFVDSYDGYELADADFETGESEKKSSAETKKNNSADREEL